MLTIHLSNLNFFCYHGLYNEEKIIGSEYLVDVKIDLHKIESVIQSIDHTLDYVQVYELIKKRMMQPTELLETIAMELADTILNISHLAKKVDIKITKKNVPFTNFEGQVSVSYIKEE